MRRNRVSPDAPAVRLRSDAAEPVPGPAFGVGHCQDAHFVFANEEDERKGSGRARPAGSRGSRLCLEAAERSEGAFR